MYDGICTNTEIGVDYCKLKASLTTSNNIKVSK